MKKTCSRCEKPLSSRYWLHIFFEDGREERRSCGKLNGDEGTHVAMYFDFKCKRGWKGRIRNVEPEKMDVEHAGGLYMLQDMNIVRDGKRILMVMPKMVAGV